MDNMYGIIESLCASKGIKPGKLCSELGISRGTIGDLKAGRTKKLSAENVAKIASYFGVSTDFVLGKEKAPAESGKRSVSDDDIKFALFGGSGDITDAMYQEVKEFAALIKLREDMKKSKE